MSEPSQNEGASPVDPVAVRLDLMESAKRTISAVMQQSFTLMGVAAGDVSTQGVTGSIRSRGYLLGLTEGVLQGLSAAQPTPEEFSHLFEATLLMTYGSHDRKWGAETVYLFHHADDDVLRGALVGRHDAIAAREGAPAQARSGFWLLNDGDEEMVNFVLSSL